MPIFTHDKSCEREKVMLWRGLQVTLQCMMKWFGALMRAILVPETYMD
jgi:hypothetical protein